MARFGRSIAGVVVFGALMAGSAVVVAQDQEMKKAVEARQAIMKSIGGNMKALSAMVKGENNETPEQAAKRADEINAAAEKIALAFKPQYHIENIAGDLKTSALPVIWTDYEDFSGKAEDLETASAELALAAETGDMGKIKTAFAAMAKTCGACHQTFRQKTN